MNACIHDVRSCGQVLGTPLRSVVGNLSLGNLSRYFGDAVVNFQHQLYLLFLLFLSNARRLFFTISHIAFSQTPPLTTRAPRRMNESNL